MSALNKRGEGLRRAGRQLASTSIILVVAASFRAGGSIILARALGPVDRGRAAIIITVAGLFAVLGSFGLDASLRYHLPRSDVQSAVRQIFVRDSSRALGVATVALLPLALVIFYSMDVLQSPSELVLAVSLLYLSLITVFALGVGRAEGFLVRAGWSEAVRTGALLGGASSLYLVFGTEQLTPYLVVLLGSSVVGLLPLLPQVMAHLTDARRGVAEAEERRTGPSLLRHGLMTQAGSISMTLAYRLDRLLLGWLRSNREVGLYSVAVAVAELTVVVPTAIAQVTFDHIAQQRSRAEEKRSLRLLAALTLVLSVAVAGGLWVLAPWLIPAVFGERYSGAVGPARILAVAGVAMSMWRVTATGLMGQGRFKSYLRGSLLALVLSAGAGVPVIAAHGMPGAAVVSVVAYIGAMAVAVVGMTQRHETSRGSDAPVSEVRT